MSCALNLTHCRLRMAPPVTIIAFSVLVLYAGTIPPLPKLPVESFTSPMREQIREAYEEALQNPERAENNGRLGMLLYGYEHFQFAEACFERARAFDSNDKRWAYYLGRTQAALGKHDQAAISLQEALRQNPGYLPAELALGESLRAAGQLDQSRKIYQAIAGKHPDAAAAYYGLGRVLAVRRETARAIEFLRKACDLYPSFGAAHYALALAYRDQGDRAKAQEHLALYQKDKLSWPPTPDPLIRAIDDLKTGASAHLKKGVRLEAAGQMQAAVEEHERALEADPKHVQARVNLITLYARLGQTEKAEEHYRALLAIDPNLVESHYNYGVMLTGQQKYKEAAEAYRRALEINPYYADAHNNYAFLLMIEGRLNEAAEHYRAAIANKPNYRLAHFNLGRILVHQGKAQEAISHFLQTLTPEDEDTPRFMYGLGAAYARAGDRKSALKYLQDARQRAAALGQSDLLKSIDKDLGVLEQGENR
jgi:tetratricopeptide (TPR) repeat protein